MEAARAKWQQDTATVECLGCRKKFSFFNRRHHCRGCGGVFCGSCCDQKVKGVKGYAPGDPQRVCRRCYATYKAAEEAAHRERKLLASGFGDSAAAGGGASAAKGASTLGGGAGTSASGAAGFGAVAAAFSGLRRPARGDRARTRKILVIGAAGVGKSSIIYRYAKGEMPPPALFGPLPEEGEEAEGADSGHYTSSAPRRSGLFGGGSDREKAADKKAAKEKEKEMRARTKSLASNVVAAASSPRGIAHSTNASAAAAAGGSGRASATSASPTPPPQQQQRAAPRAPPLSLAATIAALEVAHMALGHEYCFVFEEATYRPADATVGDPSADDDDVGGAGGAWADGDSDWPRSVPSGWGGDYASANSFGLNGPRGGDPTNSQRPSPPPLMGAAAGAPTATASAAAAAAAKQSVRGFDPRWAVGVHAIVIVYAVDDQASLHCLQGLFESMLLCGVVPPPRGATTTGTYATAASNAYTGASNDVTMVLVGAKADGPVSSREVEASDAAALANLWGIPHCEVSAQTPQFASMGGSHRYVSAAGGGDKGGGGRAGGGGSGSGLAAGGGEGGGTAGGGTSQTAARPYGAPTPSGHGHDSQLGLAGVAVTSSHFHSSNPLSSGAPPLMAGMGMGMAAVHQSSMYTHGGQPFAPMAASLFLQLPPAHQRQYLAQLQQYQQQQQQFSQQQQQQMGAGAFSPLFPHGGQHNAYPFSSGGGDAYAAFGQQPTHGHGHGQRAVVTTADGLQVLVPITAATPTAGAGGPFAPQHYGHGYNPQQQHYPQPQHGYAAGGHFGGANPLSSNPFGTNSGQYGHGPSGHYGDGDASAQQAVGVGGLAAGSEAELALIRQMQAAGVDIAAAVAASGGGAGGANAHLFFGGGTVATTAAGAAGGGGADDGSGRLCLTGLFFSSSATADASALEGPSGGGATVDTVFAYLAEEIGRKDGM